MAEDRNGIAPAAGGGKTKTARATRRPMTRPVKAAPVAAPTPVAAERPLTPEPPVAESPATLPVAPLPIAPLPVALLPVSAPVGDTLPLSVKDETMNETVTNIADKAQDQARTMFAQAGDQTRSTMEKGKKVAEDMAEFGKGNVEAIVESARIAAKGLESFGKDGATFARARYESTAETVRAMASVKSPTELMQLQADYFRSAFDAMVAEASRTTEASLKLVGEIAAPLQNRMALATDKIKAAA